MAGGAARAGWQRAALRRHWHWLIPVVVCAALLAPLASDRTFASDWGNHLWLIWVQGQNLGHGDFPSYYLQSSLGAFYPYYAFYGGTMYAALGFLSWLTSGAAAAVFAVVFAVVVAYLSWTWLAFQVGLRGWLMQLPGALAATAPYAVTNIYGRGDIPELIATSTIPLIAASGLSLLGEERLRLRSATAFVAGVAILTGTHTLTLVWGTTFLLLCGVALILSNWELARQHARRGLRLLWLGLLGVAINAWMLVPLLLYHARLLEGGPDPMSYLDFTDRTQLFSLARNGADLHPEITADVNTQLPVLLLLWTIAFGAVSWRRLGADRRRLALSLTALCAAFLLLIMTPSLIEAAPSAWAYIQFPYRLLTYFDLALVGVTTLVLAALQGRRSSLGPAAALLAIVAAIGLYASVRQDDAVRSWLPDRAAATASTGEPPASWYAPLQFADASAAVVEPTLSGVLELPVAESSRDSYTVAVKPGPAGTVATNVLAGTYLVDVVGAEPAGRTVEGRMVVALPASDRRREVTVEASWGPAVELGRWVSVAAIAIAVFAFSWALAGRLQPGALRRRRPKGARD